jgi:hypothetical protein
VKKPKMGRSGADPVEAEIPWRGKTEGRHRLLQLSPYGELQVSSREVKRDGGSKK